MLLLVNRIFLWNWSNATELVSTVDTDGLVLQHQAISSHSAEYTHMFPAVYGLNQLIFIKL